MNWFFSIWYHALANAFPEAASAITDIVEVIDPAQQINVALNDIAAALTMGLAFAVLPGLELISGATASVGRTLIKGFSQAPGVAQKIWPLGTEPYKYTRSVDSMMHS